jgi:hypothetical protein
MWYLQAVLENVVERGGWSKGGCFDLCAARFVAAVLVYDTLIGGGGAAEFRCCGGALSLCQKGLRRTQTCTGAINGSQLY